MGDKERECETERGGGDGVKRKDRRRGARRKIPYLQGYIKAFTYVSILHPALMDEGLF